MKLLIRRIFDIAGYPLGGAFIYKIRDILNMGVTGHISVFRSLNVNFSLIAYIKMKQAFSCDSAQSQNSCRVRLPAESVYPQSQPSRRLRLRVESDFSPSSSWEI
jgi:hypothetical protein